MNLTYLTICEAGTAFRNGDLSPVELTQAVLASIERLNPVLNAYLTVTAQDALAQAEAAEAAFRRGEDHGALQGIPIGLKDLYDVAGVLTTAGSPILADNVAASDSAVAERLRSGGAVLLGKQNMHEWAFGVTTANPHFGVCHNPWNLERVPGGSSGGSGAALAAGLCLGAFGSDTGGSIRIPASLCGITGLKPTRGRVSLRGVIPLSWSLDHAGPMARTVSDVAILLQAVAGYDPADPISLDVPVDDYLGGLGDGLAGVRVLVPDNYFFEVSDPEVARVVRAAIDDMGHLGATLVHVELPGVEALSGHNREITATDAYAYHAGHLRERPNDLSADVWGRMRTGIDETGAGYALARQQQRIWRRILEELLAGEAVLATPATPLAAIPIAGTDAVAAATRLTSLTSPFNLTGLPAISIPCGFTAEHLPVGLQLVGRPWGEATVLRSARAYQQATCWHLHRPPL